MTIDPNIWTNTLSSTKNKIVDEDIEANSNKWLESIPKKKNNIFKKYSLATTLFVFGLIAVSFIKNETRNLEKEITELQKSINEYKYSLHQATLEHEVITSPENISRLASEHLESDFVYYKENQIKDLNNSEENIVQLKDKNIKKKKPLSHEAKKKIKNEIYKKKQDLEKLKKIYSEPKELTKEVKTKLAKKIQTTQKELTFLYNEPGAVIKSEKAQRWAVFQVVKVFLGIPIVPGK
tara:strand:+ start:43 stop:753 length:711 start_codon:yes stop_codon:yes gene_type:complete